MKESNLRLRLVVRRHDLPEVRVLFSINLQDEPTIASLLEQVNDTVPLESADWGLDDYVVEIEDSHGYAFECLHFQPVHTILDRDEEVIIRPLFTADRKKRLLSGRHQISTDGKHLVDGVPFGRPRLRIPKGRPPVDIPPLKKRRITFDREEEEDVDEDEEDQDDEYRESDNETEDDGAALMLTEYGEDEEEPGAVRVAAHFDDADEEEPGEVRIAAVFDNADGAEEDGEDVQAQANDLYESEEAEEGVEEDEEDEEDIDEAELLDELRDLQTDNAALDEGDPSEPQAAEPAMPHSGAPSPDADLARLNKITALRRAFPAVDCHVYEDILRRNALNERMAYRELSKTYEPSMSLDQMGDLLASFSCPAIPSSNNLDAGAGEAENDAESDVESTSSLVKHYDQRGFPSGSILDGSASRVAAEALRKAGHAVRSPVHTRFDDDADAVDSTALRAIQRASSRLHKAGKATASDQSVSGEDDDDNESETSESSSSDSGNDGESGDDESFNEGSEDGSDSGSDNEETSSEDDESDSSDDAEDSGPEVASTKPSANDSNQSKKRKRGPGGKEDAELEGQIASDKESSSSEDSSEDPSGSESDASSSDESSDADSEPRATSPSTVESAKLGPPKPNETGTQRQQQQQQPETATKRSPPGQGLSKTRARNARRKLALKARKAALAKTASPPIVAETAELSSRTRQPEDPDFLQRKQALLAQLAKDPTESISSQPKDAPADLQAEPVMDKTESATIQETPAQLGSTEVTTSAMDSGSERRSKLDVGAGRRMLFASLGLRNPKTKADEDKIRGDLMKGVRPLVNHRISGPSAGTNSNDVEAGSIPDGVEDEDLDAWRSKVIYRAVECVQEGVELSEPPFPFVQRWDPQQQNAWRNKRGGRGKRKQRNQVDFYEDDSTLPSAKKQRVNHFDEDDSFASYAHEGQDQDAALNYDDIPESVPEKASGELTSKLTDMDDLPTLPDDVATLPVLHLRDAKPGMVVSWKQMILSKATNWAPQILGLTAVIVSIDEATEELRVVLARRDRHLDGREKTFDEEGNRVYDRFDAPDDEDDADGDDAEADGYRTVQFSDMMDPRIVQQPLPSPQEATLHTIAETQAQADMVMADNEGLAGDNLGKETPDGDNDNSPPPSKQPGPATENVEERAESHTEDRHGQTDENSFGSVIPDSVPKETTEAAARERNGTTSDAAQDVSITEDNRHDISAMIQEAGFRTDVTPSVAKEARFSIEDLSSPSRQLDEEMSEAVAAASHRGSRSPGRAQSAEHPSAPHPHEVVSVPPDGAADERPASAYGHDTPKANGPPDATPAVTYPQLPQLAAPDSSASSVPSGRQPDNDFGLEWGDDDLLHRSEELGEGIEPVDRSHGVGTQDDATPRKPRASVADDSDNPFDSSPLPSLDEIFGTAASFRPSQSPVKAKLSAALRSRKPEAKRDLEYEEIMRRVDDSDDWEDDQDQIKQPSPDSITWDESRGEVKEERWSQAAAVSASTKDAASKPSSFRKAVSPPSQVPKREQVSQPKKRRTATASQKGFR